MPGVAQGLQFIAVKTVAAVGEQVDQRDHGGDSQQYRKVISKTAALAAGICFHIHQGHVAPLPAILSHRQFRRHFSSVTPANRWMLLWFARTPNILTV
jgi:hypothetical protein